MHNFRLEHFFIFVCACLTSSAIFQIVSALNIWTNSFVALSVSLCLSFSFTYISLSYSYILCPFYINRQVLSWLYHHFLNRTHHAFLHHTLTIPKPFYHKYSLKNRTKLFLQVSIHSHKSRSFPSLSFLHPGILSHTHKHTDQTRIESKRWEINFLGVFGKKAAEMIFWWFLDVFIILSVLSVTKSSYLYRWLFQLSVKREKKMKENDK